MKIQGFQRTTKINQNLKSCSINVSLAGILLMSGVLPPIAELSCKPIRSKAQLFYVSPLMTNGFLHTRQEQARDIPRPVLVV